MPIVRDYPGRPLVRESLDLIRHLTKRPTYAKIFKLTSKIARKL